jgi:hypothetical protein
MANEEPSDSGGRLAINHDQTRVVGFKAR